ncbi:MAG: NUDIX domain-containing protein [Alphaproteobacteria bacterium]|nr:NUDIX domain-containing protein [Alphaproteobacteria bacterium]
MTTLKAGTIFINVKTGKIGMIYRSKYGDYTFPKGHLEAGETLQECAIRETAEETKRDVELLLPKRPYLIQYTTPKGEVCKTYMYLAKDIDKSDNTSWDAHDLVWLTPKEVADKLTYDNLRRAWLKMRPRLSKYFACRAKTD